MMMFANPFRMILVPPSPVAPHMMVVPIAVVLAPLRIFPGPFRMMVVDPARMVVMPPVRIAPFMTLVPVAIAIVRMCNHRRSREQCSQGRGGENCSKFHSGYLLKKWNSGRGYTSHPVLRCIDNASFRRSENREKSK